MMEKSDYEYKTREELLKEVADLKKKAIKLEKAISARTPETGMPQHTAHGECTPPSVWRLPGYWH